MASKSFYSKTTKSPDAQYVLQQKQRQKSGIANTSKAKILTPVSIDDVDEEETENGLNSSVLTSHSEGCTPKPKKRKVPLTKKYFHRELTNFAENLQKKIDDSLNEQAKVIEIQASLISELKEEIEEIKKLKSVDDGSKQHKTTSTPATAAAVRFVYKSYDDENKWSLHKRYNEPANVAVTKRIIESVLEDSPDTPTKEIKVACSTYFSHLSRKEKEKDKDPSALEEREKLKRCSARRSRLFCKRKGKALKLQLDDEEQRLLSLMSSEFMTDEESSDEGHLILHHIPWRIDAVNNLIAKLDMVQSSNHSVSKPRLDGEMSLRKPSTQVARHLIKVDFI